MYLGGPQMDQGVWDAQVQVGPKAIWSLLIQLRRKMWEGSCGGTGCAGGVGRGRDGTHFM